MSNHLVTTEAVGLNVNPTGSSLTMNVTMGERSYLGPKIEILDSAPLIIGKNCMMGPKCRFFASSDFEVPADQSMYGKKGSSIVVGDDCWIGGNVTILSGVSIGSGCTIGAGSTVTQDIPPRSVAVGNPARVVRTIGVRKQGGCTEAEKRDKWVREREAMGEVWGKWAKGTTRQVDDD